MAIVDHFAAIAERLARLRRERVEINDPELPEREPPAPQARRLLMSEHVGSGFCRGSQGPLFGARDGRRDPHA